MGLGGRWQTVREAYRKIAEVYERANKIVTFGQVDKWRREALRLFYALDGRSNTKVLDVGAGPGNMTRHLRGLNYVVALDITIEMLSLNNLADDRVVGDFEHMPFRDASFDLLIAGYSLHAARDLERAVAEFNRVAHIHVVVSIGNPDNRIVRSIIHIYTKYIMPRLVCILAPKEICSEYSKIYLILSSTMSNSQLRQIVSKYADVLRFVEKAFGSVYIYVSRARRGSQIAI
ncbi:MAG: class I SAM-dependent methyltransferase [Pyrobaculum sp.]